MTDENEILAGLESEFDGDAPQPLHITNEMFQRRLVWDVVPCNLAVETLKLLDLPGVSQDVEETEHTAAHERLAALGVLNITANAMAFHIARIQVETINSQNPASGLVVEGLYPILAAGIRGALAEMQDLGLIHQPHMMVPLVEMVVEEPEEPGE